MSSWKKNKDEEKRKRPTSSRRVYNSLEGARTILRDRKKRASGGNSEERTRDVNSNDRRAHQSNGRSNDEKKNTGKEPRAPSGAPR